MPSVVVAIVGSQVELEWVVVVTILGIGYAASCHPFEAGSEILIEVGFGVLGLVSILRGVGLE